MYSSGPKFSSYIDFKRNVLRVLARLIYHDSINICCDIGSLVLERMAKKAPDSKATFKHAEIQGKYVNLQCII